ncbi:oligosaccharide flippase family protein [Streptomyces aquilus]|uniref:oligosaccharide flippase family protein n=1 Tax=Streptomyces aquilus TaxID=2548456 RepID=UPI00368D67E7
MDTVGTTAADEGELTRRELERRAKGGVFLVTLRGLAILLLGFVGNVVLARLLGPHEFGVVAIGMSFVVFTSLVSDGGLGVGLIRRAEPPSRAELRALNALQLGITGSVALIAAALATPFGRIGWVTAVMVASLPLVAVQLPGRILLERALRYRRLVVVEVVEVLCYFGWAIGTVVAGFGVWGLATAVVVRAAAGAAAMAWACPGGLVRPRWSLRLVRPLVGFGLRFQAVDATWLLRDLALNAAVASFCGVSSLGLWTLAKRVMEAPYLFFHSLWRVSFPTMSRLLARKVDATSLVEQAVAVAAVGTGLLLTGLAGAAPGLVPGVFGEQWHSAAAVVPWACLGMAVGGCVSVATQGFLYASGDATSVLRAEIMQAVSWLAVALPLLPVIGVVAAGIGWTVSSVVAALVLGRATSRFIPVHLVRPLTAPVAVGVCSASIGWGIAVRGGEDLWSAALGGTSAAVLFVTGMAVANRSTLMATCRFVTDAVRAALSRPDVSPDPTSQGGRP